MVGVEVDVEGRMVRRRGVYILFLFFGTMCGTVGKTHGNRSQPPFLGILRFHENKVLHTSMHHLMFSFSAFRGFIPIFALPGPRKAEARSRLPLHSRPAFKSEVKAAPTEQNSFFAFRFGNSCDSLRKMSF